MDRRDLLRTMGATAALAGLSPDQLSALFAPGAPRTPARAFFTAEQREAVDALSDAILPETDTPGAVEAGVTDYIELIVAEWYEADERERFMRGLAHVDEHSEALSGVRFAYAGESTQVAILTGLEAEGAAMMRSASGLGARYDAPRPFFHQFRSLVLHGYYTSEIGMRDELLFRRIPGSFNGCVEVTEVTKATAGGAP